MSSLKERLAQQKKDAMTRAGITPPSDQDENNARIREAHVETT